MFYQYYQKRRTQRTIRRGKWFKWLYAFKQLQVGEGFQCDGFPDVNITQNGSIQIGKNVTFRSDIELRAHGNGKIIIEENVRIDRGVRLLVANDAIIHIKSGARVGLYAVFNGGDSITVGENALVSGFVYLQTSMHRYKGKDSIKDQGYDHAAVVLEEDVWLGAHVVVLPGVKLGKGCVVGSNAVVTKDVEPMTIVGGVPAKTIKDR